MQIFFAIIFSLLDPQRAMCHMLLPICSCVDIIYVFMHIFLIIKKQNVKFNLSLIAKKSNDLLANSVNVRVY